MNLARNVSFGLAAAAALVAAPLHAQVVLPTQNFGNVGPVPSALVPGDFGSHSTPGSESLANVAYNTFDGVTLALSETPHGSSNPFGTNDAFGDFTTAAGGDVNPADAKWNLDFSIAQTGTSSTTPYSYELFYQLQPGGPLGTLFPLAIGDNIDGSNSENLGFSFFSTSVAGLSDAPGGVFNPNAVGTYGFELVQINDNTGLAVDEVGINVTTATPEPASIGLMAMGLVGMAGFVRRRRKVAK
jgi:hypothetical protein